jgi:hypothetical protein
MKMLESLCKKITHLFEEQGAVLMKQGDVGDLYYINLKGLAGVKVKMTQKHIFTIPELVEFLSKNYNDVIWEDMPKLAKTYKQKAFELNN